MESLHCDRYIVLLIWTQHVHICIICSVCIFRFLFATLSDWYKVRAVALSGLSFFQLAEFSWKCRDFDHCDVRNARRCSVEAETGHTGYLSNSYGISLLLDDCTYDVRVICHQQIQMHFFSRMRKNGMSIGATGSRLEPMTGSWLVVTSSACTGVYTLLLRHVKV